jgi:hypothetical protein
MSDERPSGAREQSHSSGDFDEQTRCHSDFGSTGRHSGVDIDQGLHRAEIAERLGSTDLGRASKVASSGNGRLVVQDLEKLLHPLDRFPSRSRGIDDAITVAFQ